MMVDQRLWKKGEFVEMVDLDRFGPLEVPMPKRWFMLRVHPNREFKVMKTFRQRNLSAWLPLQTNTQDVKTYRYGYERIRRREVTSPLISGVIIIPDFEAEGDRWREIEGVIGILRMGPCTPSLTPKLLQDLRNIETIKAVPKSKRARLFEIGQLVRVVNGPFRQFCARIEQLDSRSRLKIGVEIFGRITPIEVSEHDIEAV